MGACASERTTAFKTQQAAGSIGAQLAAWRKLRGLTAQQVAERAGVTRQTVGRLGRGDLGVGMDVFLDVCRAVGILDRVVEATDPYETPFGRADVVAVVGTWREAAWARGLPGEEIARFAPVLDRWLAT